MQQAAGESAHDNQPPQQQQQPEHQPELFRTTSFELPDEAAHADEAAAIHPIDMSEPSTAMALKVSPLNGHRLHLQPRRLCEQPKNLISATEEPKIGT